MKKCARSKARAGRGGVASSRSRPPNGISRSAMRLARLSDRPTGQRIRRVSKPGQLRNDWRLADRVCRSIHRHRNGFPFFTRSRDCQRGTTLPRSRSLANSSDVPLPWIVPCMRTPRPAPLGHHEEVTAPVVPVDARSTNSRWWSDPLLHITPPHPERKRAALPRSLTESLGVDVPHAEATANRSGC